MTETPHSPHHNTAQRVSVWLRAVAASLLVGGWLLDLGGRALRLSALWSTGARLSSLGLLAGLAVWVIGWFLPRAGQWLWTGALCAFGLARFLRGSAGVPPDPPLLLLGAVGGVLLAGSEWRRRRAAAATRRQFPAGAAPPA